jgi:uncharacterized protein (TIGR03067 family)
MPEEADKQIEPYQTIAAADPKFTELTLSLRRVKAKVEVVDLISKVPDSVTPEKARSVIAQYAKDSLLTAEQADDQLYRLDSGLLKFRRDTVLQAAGTKGEFPTESVLDDLRRSSEELSRRPAHARIHQDLPPEERATLLSRELDEVRTFLQILYLEKQLPAFRAAVIARDAGALEGIARQAARLGGTESKVRTADLVGGDFAGFIAALQALGMDGSRNERMPRWDVALVDTVRGRFGDDPAVRPYLATGYADWARRLGDAGGALNLYLLRQAVLEAEPAQVEELAAKSRAILSDLLRKMPLQLRLPATRLEPLQANTEAVKFTFDQARAADDTDPQAQQVADASRAALKDLLTKLLGGWVQWQEGAGDATTLTLATTLAGISEEKGSWSTTWTTTTTSNGYTQQSQFTNTHHTRNHAARYTAAVQIDKKAVGQAQYDANLRYAALQVTGDASQQSRFPQASGPTFLSADTIDRRLAADLAAKIKAQPALLLHRLADGTFVQLQAEASGHTEEEHASAAWFLVEAWEAAGVRVNDWADRENDVRRVLGLTLRELPSRAAAQSMDAAGKVFENSLGQRFVPVPGTRVLFATWQTRLKDYRVFAKDPKYGSSPYSVGSYLETDDGSLKWSSGYNLNFEHPTANPDGFAQTPDDPVVTVPWNDAIAFCRWLTLKERAEGFISLGQEYRLPTDVEWSAAAGLTGESGASPKDRSDKVAGYPWGPSWPPPPGAGNLFGYDAADFFPYWQPIAYDDGFPRTSPVGSFSANPFGIHDLGTNVFELIAGRLGGSPDEVWTQGENPEVFIRGAAYMVGNSVVGISRRTPSNGASMAVGFRIVLAPVSATAPLYHLPTGLKSSLPSLGAAGDSSPAAGQSELKQALQGRWEIVSAAGQEMPEGKRPTLSFEGNRYTARNPDGSVGSAGEFHVSAAGKYAALDLKITEDPDSGPHQEAPLVEITGGRLRLCYGIKYDDKGHIRPAAKRPAKFETVEPTETTPGSMVMEAVRKGQGSAQPAASGSDMTVNYSSAPAATGDDALEGEWDVSTANGETAGPNDPHYHITLSGGRIIIKLGGEIMFAGPCSVSGALDGTWQNIDITLEQAYQSGMVGKVMPGIISHRGGLLSLGLGAPGKGQRPTGFGTDSGAGLLLEARRGPGQSAETSTPPSAGRHSASSDPLQGEWEVSDAGSEHLQPGNMIFRFEGDRWSMISGGTVRGHWSYDPSQSPMTIDFVIEEGTQGPMHKLWPCLLEINGDRMRLASSDLSWAEPQRPKGFINTPDGNYYVFELHRRR